jgi:hypothetical protein
MFRLPVLWAQNNQMTGERIEIETQNRKPKLMNLLNRGFIAQEDSAGFNQFKSKKIVGLFRNDNELYRVNGYSDAETLYYAYDGPDITCANKVKSDNVVILIADRQLQAVKHYENVEGAVIPPHEFDMDELTLKGFKWQIKLKPADKTDIYEWKEDDGDQSKKTAPAHGGEIRKPVGNTRPAGNMKQFPASKSETSVKPID